MTGSQWRGLVCVSWTTRIPGGEPEGRAELERDSTRTHAHTSVHTPKSHFPECCCLHHNHTHKLPLLLCNQGRVWCYRRCEKHGEKHLHLHLLYRPRSNPFYTLPSNFTQHSDQEADIPVVADLRASVQQDHQLNLCCGTLMSKLQTW